MPGSLRWVNVHLSIIHLKADFVAFATLYIQLNWEFWKKCHLTTTLSRAMRDNATTQTTTLPQSSHLRHSVIGNMKANLRSSKSLERLREEVDEIAHIVLQTPLNSPQEPKHLTEIIDNMLKKRLSGIWDDIYTIRKQLKSSDCARITSSTHSTTKANTVGTPDPSGAGFLTANPPQRVNYASEELGAKIKDVTAEPVCPPSFIKSLLNMDFASNPPVQILRSSMEPGSCFAFRNDKAVVTIRLAQEIVVDQIELGHISKKLSPTEDTSSAPKAFSVYGINLTNCNTEFLLGKFTFDNKPDKAVQSFPVKDAGRQSLLRFKFETNHGHPNYTCVYRIAVYGTL